MKKPEINETLFPPKKKLRLILYFDMIDHKKYVHKLILALFAPLEYLLCFYSSFEANLINFECDVKYNRPSHSVENEEIYKIFFVCRKSSNLLPISKAYEQILL